MYNIKIYVHDNDLSIIYIRGTKKYISSRES